MNMIESSVPTAQEQTQWPEMVRRIRNTGAPITITENGAPTAVLLPFDTFIGLLESSQSNSLRETAYLLRSPANAERLLRSLEDIRRGKVEYHDLIEVEDDEE